jgi:hypothetical protein
MTNDSGYEEFRKMVSEELLIAAAEIAAEDLCEHCGGNAQGELRITLDDSFLTTGRGEGIWSGRSYRLCNVCLLDIAREI